MKKTILELVKHPLILGSSVIFIGSLFASVINYVFNLAMGRSLSVADYGTFASLVSIFNIFSVFTIAIMMVFSKFSAELIGQKKEKFIGSLFISGNTWVAIMSAVICAVLLMITPQLSSFLNIDSNILVIITIFTLFFYFLFGVPAGVLQGLLKFNYFSFLNISSSFVKLLLGVVFVFLGYGVFGAIIAFFLSTLAGYVLGVIFLFKFIKEKIDDGFTLSSFHRKAYAYALPVFFSNIGITALIALDIILVKHYFSATIAGQYAALSLMGRSIFYVVSPISSVLFPIMAQKRAKQERLIGTLLLSIGLVVLPSVVLSSIYFMFPRLILGIFFPGASYLSIAPYLGQFSVFILFYSLSFLLNSFYLSIGKVKVLFFTVSAALAETAVIIGFHSSIAQVINGLIIVAFLLLLSLLLYYLHAAKNPNS